MAKKTTKKPVLRTYRVWCGWEYATDSFAAECIGLDEEDE